MADSKITALTAISTVDPAADPLVIVDVSDTSMAASGTTKKGTINQLLGAGGTATLASATITGDLTVRTTGLTTTASAVGINTASPTANTLTIGANRFIICSDSQSKFGDNGLINGAAADGNTQIQFFGSKSLFFNEGVSTRMTLNATGLGVGTSPSFKLDVQGQSIRLNSGSATGFALLRLGGTASDSFFGFAGNANDIVTGTSAGDTVIGSNKAGANLRFISGNGSLNATLDASGALLVGVTSANASGGVLQLKSGITFPATQVASSDANTLDDYEEGTWTIGLEFGGASTGMTTNANTGKYTKIGRQVTVTGYLALTNKGSATGDALITGLPFLINSYGGLSIYLNAITFADFPMGYSNNGTSTIPLRECTNAGVTSSLTDSDFANNSEIIFTMTYNVA